MTKEEWKTTIEGQIKFDHDYIPSFQTTIQILSEMLEERDRVYTQYLEDGARPVVEFTSDRGATNLKQNPLLRQWQEINTLCLSYLRDLGLTAAGLRKLQGNLPKEKYEGFTSVDAIRNAYGLNDLATSRDKMLDAISGRKIPGQPKTTRKKTTATTKAKTKTTKTATATKTTKKGKKTA